ncbi:hypothetical protein QBC34DRAFT_496939 [Podospora aff. communis PSN243]|uniref:GST N-terminal domain-containing protein n=1 Tax=Podospora aff. communis PSN243 TaxID=3040156 RepID=A0AAV9GEA3_9PEZI|nr:hypothetical protein QBC34DRAFT_496939 [Podospora aff. communis PSN243]
MEPDATFVLYDIASLKPYTKNSGAPNPWKARYALNFKGVPYRTEWVLMPDIGKVRKSLGLPACRKFADGTDFYTLPVLVTDPKNPSSSAIGDSFDIANYLEKTFPGAGAGDLFPEQKLDYELPAHFQSLVPLSERDDDLHADYVKFQANVDMAFSVHTQLAAHGMRWDPEVEEAVRAEFLRRIGKKSWDELAVEGEAREQLKASFKATLGGLAALLQRDPSGPFMLGAQPSYADIIVGGWLRMMWKALPTSEWEELTGWYDGVFGKLHAALQERFGEMK